MTEESQEDLNNNVTVSSIVQGHASSLSATEKAVPCRSEGRPSNIAFEERVEVIEADSDDNPLNRSSKLEQSFTMLQNFMIKKGLMTEVEMQEILGAEGTSFKPDGSNRIRDSGSGWSVVGHAAPQSLEKAKGKKNKDTARGKRCSKPCEDVDNLSEVTIYKRAVAVPGVPNEAEANINIDCLLTALRPDKEGVVNRKISSSSDEFMDTSDECDTNANVPNFVGGVEVQPEPGRSNDPRFGLEPRKTSE